MRRGEKIHPPALVYAPWKMIPGLGYMEVEELKMPVAMATFCLPPSDWWCKFTFLWVSQPNELLFLSVWRKSPHVRFLAVIAAPADSVNFHRLQREKWLGPRHK